MPHNIDLKDKKILFELDKNSRISLVDLAKKVRLSKEVVFHRINNLLKRNYILRFQPVITANRLGYQSYKIYFKLQNITVETKNQIQSFFVNHANVYWVGNCQGRWDLIVAYWAKNVNELGKFDDEILNQFSSYILEKEFTISRKTWQYNRRWFFNDTTQLVETDFGEELEEVKIDDIDFEILKLLAINARIKTIDIAKKINSSVNVARYRIKTLEKRKVILGYKYALNSKKLGYETCKAFISLKDVTAEKKNFLVNYCKMFPNVVNIILTIGSWDMEIEFEVKNFDEFYELMNKIQENHGDIIRNYDSVLFSSEPKQIFVPDI